MPDTRRSLSSLQTLLADNTAGDISAQDARDVLISEHPEKTSQSAAAASVPASGQLIGDLFFPNNGFYAYRYNGTIWEVWGPVWPLTEPIDANYAWINQGGATVTTTNGGVILFAPAQGNVNNLRIRKKAAPATPYTITAHMKMTLFPKNYMHSGLGWRQSSDGKLIVFGNAYNSTLGNVIVSADKYTNATTYSANIIVIVVERWYDWLRISDDGVNRKGFVSVDGVSWIEIYSEARTTFLTGDEVFFYADAVNLATPNREIYATLLSWKEA